MKEKPVNRLGELLRAKLAHSTNEVKIDMAAARQMHEYEVAVKQAAINIDAQRQAMLQNNIYSAMNQAAMQNNIYAAQPKEDPFNPNNEPAYQIELSTLCDLWRAKHGDMWVRIQTRGTEDEFWIDATERLGSAGKLESQRGWLRLKD